MARRVLSAAAVAVAASLLAACGQQSVQLSRDDPHYAGARLFVERCGSCHTFDVAGTQGSTTDVGESERVDGPNFNERAETVEDVLYAIANGGFSGAIMPENIATGAEARAIAEFLAKYAGGGEGGAPGLEAPGSDSDAGG